MAQPSPYTPGEVAREVPGRDVQLAEIGERLAYMTQLGRLVGRIRVDHGPRGSGKTSLLRHVQHRAEEAGAGTVWVTAGAEPLAAALGEELLRAADRWAPEHRGRVRDAMGQLAVTAGAGVPGVASVQATWHGQATAAAAATSSPRQSTVRAFEDLIVAVHQGAHDAGRTGLVLFVDEIQAADPLGLRILAYAWAHFQAERPDLPAAVFAAGLPDSVAVINEAVSNTERLAYRQLDRLSYDATLLALAGPARSLGVTWQAAALDRAAGYAGGYPHLVQLVADNAWKHASLPDPGGAITEEHVDAAITSAAADITQLYDARLAKIRPSELRLVQALAQLGDGPARRADIAARMNVPTDAIGVARARLIGAGIITTADHGTLEFTIPGFAAHVRDHFNLPPTPPAPARTTAQRNTTTTHGTRDA